MAAQPQLQATVLRTEEPRREKSSLAWVGSGSEISRTAPEHLVRPTPNAGNGLAVIVVGVNHRNQICSSQRTTDFILSVLEHQ